MKGTSGIRFDKPGIDPTDGDDDWRGIFTGAKRDLKSRKQELVRNAILDAAIALFEKKGFDQTDVAEIAEAAGISKRSFFRYFATKDDLLARSVMEYGAVLVAAIRSAPRQSTDLEVIHAARFSDAVIPDRIEMRAGTPSKLPLQERRSD